MRTDTPPRSTPSRPTSWLSGPPEGRSSAAASSRRDGFSSAGSKSSTIERFNLADGKKVSFAGGHDSWVFSLAFSPDGEKTYSGGGEGRVVDLGDCRRRTQTDHDDRRPRRMGACHRRQPRWQRARDRRQRPDGPALESVDRFAGSRVERTSRPYLFAGISSRRQVAFERRSPGRDQGMGYELRQGDWRLRRQSPSHL